MITLYYYQKKLAIKQKPVEQLLRSCLKKKVFCWLDVTNPTKQDVSLLKKIIGFHSLVEEDLLSTNVRPKLETFSHHNFLVVHDIELEKEKMSVTQLNFLIGKHFLVSFSKKPIANVKKVKSDKDMLTSLLKKTPGFLMHKIIDTSIDGYFVVMNELEQEIDKLQNKVLRDASPDALQHLFKLKNKINQIRRVCVPQRDVISLLTKQKIPFLHKDLTIYFKDVYDNLIHIGEKIDMNREIISNVLDLHLSVTSNKMNEIMKVLTLIATIMLPLTVIGSIYGMNFRYMPELEWKYGYFTVLGIMFFIVVLMIWFFKKKKWV